MATHRKALAKRRPTRAPASACVTPISKLQSDVIDVIAGQTYDVFGWQNFILPARTVQFLGVPNQVFSRNTQFRLSKTFGARGPVSVDVAVSAVRPVPTRLGDPRWKRRGCASTSMVGRG